MNVDLDSVVIRLQDAREVGGCKAGWKEFLETHGYDFKTVVKEGLTAQQLLDTNDYMATLVVEHVLKRDYNG